MKKWLKHAPVVLRTEEKRCPCCGGSITAVSGMTTENAPTPCDFTICIYCANLLRFTATMDYEKAELMDIPTHSRLAFAQAIQGLKELKSK